MSAWLTTPIALALLFEVVSTLAQIAGFGGFLIWQRSNFERRFTTLEVQHQAERKADRAQYKRENDELRQTVRILTNVVRELNPNADLPPITAAHEAVVSEGIKHLREFIRTHYSADDVALLMADFGVEPDEYHSDAVVMRIDKFIRRMNRDGRIDELRDRAIKDRPAAAAAAALHGEL